MKTLRIASAILSLSLLASTVGAQTVASDPRLRSRAILDPSPAPIYDGDTTVPETEVYRPTVARPTVSSGALGRTVANDMGIAPGSVVIDSRSRRLFLGLDQEHVRVYPVAVGKQGAQWRGTAVVGRKAVNPSWHPTARQRRLKRVPRMVAAGPRNPLGVRALYLFKGGRDTLYRIHGTNQPGSIGKSVSSGCIRMRNADVIDLYGRVPVGTVVTVR